MPELPEVETIRRGLGDYILNKKIVQVEVDPGTKKAFIGDEGNVVDAVVVGLRRKGKALIIDLGNGWSMLVHLRMTGQLIWRDSLLGRTTSSDSPVRGSSTLSTAPLRANATSSQQNESRIPHQIASFQGDPAMQEMLEHQFAAGHPSKNFIEVLPNRQTRVTFVFNDGTLYFNDQRKFGFVKVLKTEMVEEEKFIKELAKEPWEMSVQELYSKCQKHGKSPIKAVLLDQKIIAGLGNIYADEALFYASVHPETRAGFLTEEEVELILEGARSVMMKSIELGGSTMATYVKPDGSTGNYLENFAKVFRREGRECLRCGATLTKIRVVGRGTHICPECQKVKTEVKGGKNKC